MYVRCASLPLVAVLMVLVAGTLRYPFLCKYILIVTIRLIDSPTSVVVYMCRLRFRYTLPPDL